MHPTKLKPSLCILEADESTRLRMGNSTPNNHEDHIEGKGDDSLQHYNLIHKFHSCASSHENSCSRSRGGQGMGQIEEIFVVELDKSQKVRKR